MIATERLDATAAHIQCAAISLRAGGLVAFPTETVYGLGARADHAEAVLSVYRVKGRPADKPLIVHVRDIPQARPFAARWDGRAQALATAFWPGPLTLVVPAAASVPHALTAGSGTVAVRCPAHPVALALLDACGFAIAAPSANRSGHAAPTTADEVLAELGGEIDLVLDAGAPLCGVPSTLVDLTRPGDELVLLREGALSRAEIERVWRSAAA